VYNELVQLFPEQKTYFRNNYSKLMLEIKEAGSYASRTLKPYEGRTFLIFHPSIGYLADEYGLIMESIELEGKEPSPTHMKEVIDLARDKDIKLIFVQQEFDKRNAQLVSDEIDGNIVTVGGMSKGSGMIHPNMATMLAFVSTDAEINKELLQEIIGEIVDDTYNMISVDGDTSTNDMLIALANGLSEVTITKDDESYKAFYKALKFVNTYLAQQIIHDGEGVTKVVEARVVGAKNKVEAKLVAKSVITSNLFKTALFGSDANWGRILCAMGYSGANFDHEKVSLAYVSDNGRLPVLNSGVPIPFEEDYALYVLSQKEIIVEIVMQEGNGEAIAWGCDLSYEYVKINGEYRS
jgi:glutamate N-acetyltransferase/amino-acid N-acetyltransferase